MRGVAPPRLRAAQAGISLVETLVALALGLAMVSVAFNLYVSNRAVFRQIEAMVRLQESASIAATLLETSIRHAGGTLCRNNQPTTILLNASSPYWEYEEGKGLLGLRGYESSVNDPIVRSLRIAGDSISVVNHNSGALARVADFGTPTVDTNGLSGIYRFEITGTDLAVGDIALACDYARAVLFQISTKNNSRITLRAGTQALTPTPSPGNCGVFMKRASAAGQGIRALDGPYSCAGDKTLYSTGEMYKFGPGTMIVEHSFEHWYLGRKTGTTNGLSLFRVKMGYDTAGNVKLLDAEEIVQDVTDMQITYLPGLLSTGYPASSDYETATQINARSNYTFRSVTGVRIVLTLTSPEAVGLAANNAASAATYTIPINVAIRARMPGVVRR